MAHIKEQAPYQIVSFFIKTVLVNIYLFILSSIFNPSNVSEKNGTKQQK